MAAEATGLATAGDLHRDLQRVFGPDLTFKQVAHSLDRMGAQPVTRAGIIRLFDRAITPALAEALRQRRPRKKSGEAVAA